MQTVDVRIKWSKTDQCTVCKKARFFNGDQKYYTISLQVSEDFCNFVHLSNITFHQILKQKHYTKTMAAVCALCANNNFGIYL